MDSKYIKVDKSLQIKKYYPFDFFMFLTKAFCLVLPSSAYFSRMPHIIKWAQGTIWCAQDQSPEEIARSVHDYQYKVIKHVPIRQAQHIIYNRFIL